MIALSIMESYALSKPELGFVHHIALAVHNLEESVTYYQEVLGLSQLDTPDSAYSSGIRWFDLGGYCALHLIEVPWVIAPPRAHLAITVADNDAWRAYLEGKGVRIVEPTVDLYAAKRFFLKDPTGNLVELVEWLKD